MKAIIDKFFRIQQSWKFTFHGVAMNRVMIFEMYHLARGWEIGTPNKWLRLACHTYDLSKLNFSSHNQILSTFGQQNRRDHKEVYDYVVEHLGSAISYNDLNELPRIRRVRPWLILKVVLASMWGLRHCNEIDTKQKLRLSLCACVYCNALVDLEKLPLTGIKKYLSMYHVDQLENLITQYMKLKHIPTYSLCEGVYLVDKEHPTIDVVNYTNFETDHLLVWGQYVIDQFLKEGISPNRMMIAGYPHYVTLKKMRIENKFKKCFVLLARRDFMEADMRLLQILSQISNNYEFYLKPHPNSDMQTFANYAKEHHMYMVPQTMTINECISDANFDWAIAVNTTAYYESLMRGVPCLRFADESFKLFSGSSDEFGSVMQLEERLEWILSNLSNGMYQQDVDKQLRYVMGVEINNYAKILLEETPNKS